MIHGSPPWITTVKVIAASTQDTSITDVAILGANSPFFAFYLGVELLTTFGAYGSM